MPSQHNRCDKNRYENSKASAVGQEPDHDCYAIISPGGTSDGSPAIIAGMAASTISRPNGTIEPGAGVRGELDPCAEGSIVPDGTEPFVCPVPGNKLPGSRSDVPSGPPEGELAQACLRYYRGQFFSEQLPRPVESHLDNLLAASQDRSNLTVGKVFVLKQQNCRPKIVRQRLDRLPDCVS
jgi:hypothetical protein